jgi:hypothetical protein
MGEPVKATEASSPIASSSPGPPAAPKPSFFLQNDLGVVALAAVLLLGGAFGYRALTAPKMTTWVSGQGLSIRVPADWIPLTLSTQKTEMGALQTHHRHASAAVLPFLDVEIRKFDAPPGDIGFAGLSAALDARRLAEYHEFYRSIGTQVAKLKGRTWDRTPFRHAEKRSDADDPQVYAAVEYATMNNGNLYVVTLHGSDADVKSLESTIFDTLEVSP